MKEMLKELCEEILGKKQNNNYRVVCLCVLLLFFLLIEAAVGDEKKPVVAPDIHVTADRLVSDRNAKYAEFSGQVVAIRDGAKLTCSKLKIIYNDEKSGDADQQSGGVDKMIATGNVRLMFDDKIAVAERAVFTAADDSIVLTGGDPKVTGGSSYITGEKITLYRTSGKVHVDRRVEAMFHPADKVLTEKQKKK